MEPDGAFRPDGVAPRWRGPQGWPATRTATQCDLVDGSLEAQRAIVPPAVGAGDKSPGEAALYMGIVHVAMHVTPAVAIEGGYYPYAVWVPVPTDTSPAAAVAAAAHGRPFCRTPRLVEMIVEAAVPSDLDDRGHCSHRLRHARAFIASLSVRHSQQQGLEEAQQRLGRLPPDGHKEAHP